MKSKKRKDEHKPKRKTLEIQIKTENDLVKDENSLPVTPRYQRKIGGSRSKSAGRYSRSPNRKKVPRHLLSPVSCIKGSESSGTGNGDLLEYCSDSSGNTEIHEKRRLLNRKRRGTQRKSPKRSPHIEKKMCNQSSEPVEKVTSEIKKHKESDGNPSELSGLEMRRCSIPESSSARDAEVSSTTETGLLSPTPKASPSLGSPTSNKEAIAVSIISAKCPEENKVGQSDKGIVVDENKENKENNENCENKENHENKENYENHENKENIESPENKIKIDNNENTENNESHENNENHEIAEECKKIVVEKLSCSSMDSHCSKGSFTFPEKHSQEISPSPPSERSLLPVPGLALSETGDQPPTSSLFTEEKDADRNIVQNENSVFQENS